MRAIAGSSGSLNRAIPVASVSRRMGASAALQTVTVAPTSGSPLGRRTLILVVTGLAIGLAIDGVGSSVADDRDQTFS